MYNFIKGNEISVIASDSLFLTIKRLADNKVFCEVEPRVMFPRTEPNKNIALITSTGEQIGVVKDLSEFNEEDRTIVEKMVKEFYNLTTILKVYREYNHNVERIWSFECETDRGFTTIGITNHTANVKVMPNNRVIIKDFEDNRYEIPDYTKLDAKSQKHLFAAL